MAGDKGIEISILANTKSFQAGTKDVAGSLEYVSDALDDLAKDAAKSGDKLEEAFDDVPMWASKTGNKLGDEISDGAKEAERGVEKLEASFKDLATASKRETESAGTALKKNTKDSTTAAARDLGELKDEAVQNASETFSSFDGSVDSFVDGLQGTFGGIVSSMGPMGAALGAALALGIGVAVAKGTELAEAINSAKERSSELAAEIIEADGDISKIRWAEKFTEWGLAIEDTREWWEFWQKDAKTAMDVAEEAADKYGASLDDLALGLSGIDSKAASRSISELTDQMKKLEAQRDRAQSSDDRNKFDAEINGRQKLIEKLEQQGGVTEEAARQAEVLAGVVEKQAAADDAAAAAMDARTDAANKLQSELDGAVSSWSEYRDAETGATDPAAYIAAMQARMDATSNFNTNVQSLATQFGLSTDEVQTLLDQGVDFAPMLQSIMDSGLADEFVAQIRTAVGGGQELIDGTGLNATVTADADTKNATAKIEQASEDRDTEIKTKADTKAADAALDATASKSRTATIGARTDLAAARAAIDRLVEDRSITIRARVVDQRGQAVP